MKYALSGLVFLIAAFGAAPAHAWQLWPLGWWPGHWEWTEYKKFNPYLENGKETQNQQWADEDWVVEDWISQHEDPEELIRGFYTSDILREQTEEDGVPVIIVGNNFYRLGGLDKRRVMTTLDTVYGVTDSERTPVIRIKDWHTKRTIGVFSKEGLQIE